MLKSLIIYHQSVRIHYERILKYLLNKKQSNIHEKRNSPTVMKTYFQKKHSWKREFTNDDEKTIFKEKACTNAGSNFLGSGTPPKVNSSPGSPSPLCVSLF
jgi:hypothetical protein